MHQHFRNQAGDSGAAVTERCCKNQRDEKNPRGLRTAAHSSTEFQPCPQDPSPEPAALGCSPALPRVGESGTQGLDAHVAPPNTATAPAAQSQDGAQETRQCFH